MKKFAFFVALLVFGVILYIYLIGLNPIHIFDPVENSSSFEDVMSKVNCSSEINENHLVMDAKNFLSEETLIRRTTNCQDYFHSLRFLKNESRSLFDVPDDSEEEFPLAFGINVHEQISVLETMLMLIFRRKDSYCVHLDAKASKPIKQAANQLIKCYKEEFPNVNIFIAPDNIAVYWGKISVLKADLICLKHLLESNKDWKLFLNPAGTELPIMNIEKIRGILKQFENTSVVNSRPLPEDKSWRLHNLTAPFDLAIRKGSKNVALTRSFAEYILNDEVAKTFYEWIQQIEIPDEQFYATLVTIKSVFNTNGTIKVHQDLVTDRTYGHCIRYSNWVSHKLECKGTWIRDICNFGVGDILAMKNGSSENCLMANKFTIPYQPLAIFCMAKHILDSD